MAARVRDSALRVRIVVRAQDNTPTVGVSALFFHVRKLTNGNRGRERGDALRFDDFTAEGEARPDIRIRTRGAVIAVRVRDSA